MIGTADDNELRGFDHVCARSSTARMIRRGSRLKHGEHAVNSPARYLPFAHGRYDVAPGLSRFGRDFGNGEADCQVFQIDSDFPRYRAVKLAARAERLDKYFVTHELADEVATAVAC